MLEFGRSKVNVGPCRDGILQLFQRAGPEACSAPIGLRGRGLKLGQPFSKPMREFPKIGDTLFGVLIIRILLFRVLY